jgi:iron-sulfur cluster repair protein YtfE (RIC family)
MTRVATSPQAVWAFEEHEHRDLTRGLNDIHEAACEFTVWVPAELSRRLLGIVDWARNVLEPHVAWEEEWLYPELDTRTGTPWATRSARFDHQQIRAVVERIRDDQQHLSGPSGSDRLSDLRCHLFSLEALLRSHIEREERFLNPLLLEGQSESGAVGPTDRANGPASSTR